MDAIRGVTGIQFREIIGPARAGDPPQVIASIERIRRELGWSPCYGLDQIVRSDWQALVGPHAAVDGGSAERRLESAGGGS